MKKNLTYILFLVVILVQGCTSGTKLAVSDHETQKQISQKARDFYLQGLYLQGENHYSDALVQFHRALIFDTTSATIYNSLAESYIHLNLMSKALAPLKKSLKLAPDNPTTLNLLGESYFRLQQDSLAVPIYEKIVKLTPYDTDARNFLSFLYEKNKQPLKKARLLENTLDMVGYSEHQLRQIADLYTQSRDYKSAIRVLNKILSHDSTDGGLYFYMGQLLEAQQKPDSAIIAYQKANRLIPGQKEYFIKLTNMYRSNRRFQDIVKLYRPLIKKDPSNAIATLAIAEAFYFMNALDSTRGVLAPLIKKGNAPWGAYDLMGRIALDKKEYPQAIANFKEVIKQDEKNRFGWLFLGFSYSDSGDLANAENTFRQAVKKIPRDGSLWSWLGVVLQRGKKYKEAIMPYQQALALDPKNLNALSSLPVVYESLKMYALSDSSYQMALRQLPTSALILNNYAYSLAERDVRLDKAREMSERALKMEPNNGSYLDTMGWILYKLGDFKNAEDYLLRAIKTRDSSSIVFEHLGDAYLKLGNPTQAMLFWTKAIELDPKNKELKDKITRSSKLPNLEKTGN